MLGRMIFKAAQTAIKDGMPSILAHILEPRNGLQYGVSVRLTRSQRMCGDCPKEDAILEQTTE